MNFDTQCKKINRLSLSLSLVIFVFASLALLYNYLQTHYIGNLYTPDKVGAYALLLVIIFLGCMLQFGFNSTITQISYRFCLVFALLFLLAYLTTAVQFTPFAPIDRYLLAADRFLQVDTVQILHFVYQYPLLVKILNKAYAFLHIEIVLTCITVILFRHDKQFAEFVFLFLLTGLIGFAIYYLFPTTAPASLLKSAYFSAEQLDTGKKFYQIHQHLVPTTMRGGMVAMPSFHCIWALICQRYFRHKPLIAYLLLPINASIICACLFLGWHYFVDILVSLAIFLLCQKLAHQLIYEKTSKISYT